MPEIFARMHVREMNLHRWQTRPGDCIPNGHAGVSVSGSIDDDGAGLSFRLLDPCDQFTFDIRLPEIDLNSLFRRVFPAMPFNVSQRGSSINLRLTRAKQIEVWAVENEYLHAVKALSD